MGTATGTMTGNGQTMVPTQAQGQGQATPVKLLLTVEEAARALSLSRTSLFGLLATGELFSVKVRGRRLVPVKALHEFVDGLVTGTGMVR